MDTKTLVTQFKRELWENKISFIIAPALVTAFVLLMAICLSLYLSGAVAKNTQFNFKADIHFGEDTTSTNPADTSSSEASGQGSARDIIASMADDPKAFDNIVLNTMYSNCVFIYLVFSIVLSSYALRCLFDDRKNKDILFWRSMPVSETMNVLVKLGMIILVAPIIVLMLNFLVTLLTFIIGLILFSALGVSAGTLLSSIAHGQSLYIPFQIFCELVFGMLMLLPLIGFAFLASALSKKSPFFLFASPALVGLVDFMANKFVGLNLGFIDLLTRYLSALVHTGSAFVLGESLTLDTSMLLPFMLCLGVGAAFISGAIWLRNHCYEI